MKIKAPFEQEKLFFASDCHFAHKNIIEFSKRPFNDVNEMNGKLIDNWNKIVPPDGIVFYLGDFGFGSSKTHKWIRDRLNGRIYFCFGNHDREKEIKALKFHEFADLYEISVAERVYDIDTDVTTTSYQKIVLCHYPILSFHGAHKGFWHLFGHCHGNLDHPHPAAIDVGVDCNNYGPISYDDVKRKISERLKTRSFRPVDHHG